MPKLLRKLSKFKILKIIKKFNFKLKNHEFKNNLRNSKSRCVVNTKN